MDATPSLLTFEEAADVLRRSRTSVYALTQASAEDPIPTVRIGRKRLIRVVDLDAWIARRVEDGTASAA